MSISWWNTAPACILPLLHVPLIVVHPGSVAANQRSATPVSLANLPATVLALTGVQQPQEIPGKSWLDTAAPEPSLVFSGAQVVSDYYPSWFPARRGTMRSVIGSGFHYIVHEANGAEELYSIQQHDPNEPKNLANERPEIVAKFKYLPPARKAGSVDFSRKLQCPTTSVR